MKFLGHIKASGCSPMTTVMDLDEFKSQSGIELEVDEEIDEYTEEEIADFVINHFDDEETRYGMGIDPDATITFTGYQLVTDEDYEDGEY